MFKGIDWNRVLSTRDLVNNIYERGKWTSDSLQARVKDLKENHLDELKRHAGGELEKCSPEMYPLMLELTANNYIHTRYFPDREPTDEDKRKERSGEILKPTWKQRPELTPEQMAKMAYEDEPEEPEEGEIDLG